MFYCKQFAIIEHEKQMFLLSFHTFLYLTISFYCHHKCQMNSEVIMVLCSNKAGMVGIFDEFPSEAIQLPIHCKFVLFVCCCFQLEMSELLTPTKI